MSATDVSHEAIEETLVGNLLRIPSTPRNFREADKQPEDATTVQELIELYQSQGRK